MLSCTQDEMLHVQGRRKQRSVAHQEGFTSSDEDEPDMKGEHTYCCMAQEQLLPGPEGARCHNMVVHVSCSGRSVLSGCLVVPIQSGKA